jgi:hypothetical protein
MLTVHFLTPNLKVAVSRRKAVDPALMQTAFTAMLAEIAEAREDRATARAAAEEAAVARAEAEKDRAAQLALISSAPPSLPCSPAISRPAAYTSLVVVGSRLPTKNELQWARAHQQHATEPFGFELGPFSARRTHRRATRRGCGWGLIGAEAGAKRTGRGGRR